MCTRYLTMLMVAKGEMNGTNGNCMSHASTYYVRVRVCLFRMSMHHNDELSFSFFSIE